MRSSARRLWGGLLGLTFGLLSVGACSPLESVQVPDNTPFEKVRWADQGWTEQQRARFHHLPQGTATVPMPVEWFRALEQPSLWPGERGLIAEPDYLRRFGFIVEDNDDSGLPIGFAVTEDYEDPATGECFAALGLTCAACHTGQLEYLGVSFRIEGAPATVALDRFFNVLALSILETTYVPGRFGRVADRILGSGHTARDEQRLEQQLDHMRAFVLEQVEWRWKVRDATVREGFGRLDAMTRYGNQLFARRLSHPDNFHGYTAPVSYPPLWDTPWFDRTLYDASMAHPLLRGVSEALGMGAGINLTAPERGLFASTLRIGEQLEAKRWLAGPQQPLEAGGFTGLLAPQWPEDLLGEIDRGRAAKGEQLYNQLCMKCHGPPPNREDFFDETWWTKPDARGLRFLKLPAVALDEIGTDPARVRSVTERRVQVPDALGLEGPDDLAHRLGQVTQRAVAQWVDARADASTRVELDGARTPEVSTAMAYRPRPLDGVWATAPYLHNGSVPSLYDLLSPLEERPTSFGLGSRQFDPVKVGYEQEPTAGGFVLDTRIPGNHNTGHVFDDGDGPGIVGPKLSEEQRNQLVEFMKTITSRRLAVGLWEIPSTPPPSRTDPRPPPRGALEP